MDFQSEKSFGKLRLRAFQPIKCLPMSLTIHFQIAVLDGKGKETVVCRAPLEPSAQGSASPAQRAVSQ